MTKRGNGWPDLASRTGGAKAKLCALIESDVAVALFFFILGLSVRWWFAASHPDYNGLVTVRGVPFSDGETWTYAAIQLLHGEGFGRVYRPFYSVILALFYVWTDWSFTIITCLNVAIGALSAAFLFLTVRLSFNRWIGFVAAMFFAFDPAQVIKTPEAATEPLGLLFFILSLYFMLEVGRARSASASLLSGLFFGLSNLTRPLTLFCAPAYALLLLVFEWMRERKLRWAIAVVAIFTTGIVVSMAPWMIRQKLVNNVWSVSTNMGEALYAATSPKYRTWTQQVRRDADRAGVKPTVGGLHAFYMRRSMEQIREYPGFYLRQTGLALWEYLNCFDRVYRTKDRTFFLREPFIQEIESQNFFFFCASAMLLLAGLWKMRSDLFSGAIFLAVSSLVVGLWRILPIHANFVILCAGFVLGFLRGRSKQNVILLAVSLLITALGSALFNNPTLFRAVLMTDWLFAAFYLAAFYYAASALTSIFRRTSGKRVAATGEGNATSPSLPFVVAFEGRVKFGTKMVALLFVVFAAVSGARLVLANAHSEQPPEKAATFDAAQKSEILQKLRSISPALAQALPPIEAVQFYVSPRNTILGRQKIAAPSGKTIVAVESGIVPYFVHHFPSGTEFVKRSHVFAKRPFGYSMFKLGWLDVVFPGHVPREMSGGPAVVVGKIEPPKRSSSYRFVTLDCEAIIPFVGGEGKRLDYAHVIISKSATASRKD